MTSSLVEFSALFSEPTRNGLTRPKAVRGSGTKMINMGELFANPRIKNVQMDRVPLSDKEAGKFLVHENDLLFARQSLVLEGAGKCSIFLEDDEKVTFESHIIRVRLNSRKADPLFYFYYFRSYQGRAVIESIVEQGAGVSGIRGGDLAVLKVHYLPVSNQKAIAHILGSLDDKIELNRKMNETLEAMARAIFKSWFVDFDPVSAKAEGRDPDLPKEIAELFPDDFEESQLGEIPRGWKIRPIGEAVRCVGGSTPSTKNPRYWEGGTNSFVTPKDMSSLASLVIFDTERHITDAGVEKISSRQLPVGTVLLSSRAPIGYLAITEIPASVNQGIIAMICDGDLPKHYVLYWVEVSMETIKGSAGGTTFAEISKKNFRPIPALVPSDKVLAAFVKFVEPVHRRIVNNLRESATLATIRDALLPKLTSGEIRVKDAEKMVKESAAAPTEKVTPFRGKQTKTASPEPFREAILIATLVRGLAKKEYPLGRFRYTKMSYFVHRKAKHDVTTQYMKKAAGPYNPNARYKGPEKIATENNYIAPHKYGSLYGYIAGSKVNDIDKYIDRYGYREAVKWAIDKLKYKSNEDLELLATVDLAALELKANSAAVTAESIRQFIDNEKAWQDKLKKDLFSSKNIQRALNELKVLFHE